VVPTGLTLAVLGLLIDLIILALYAFAPASVVALAATVAVVGTLVTVVALALASFIFMTRLRQTVAR
jgi:hypothetical protein